MGRDHNNDNLVGETIGSVYLSGRYIYLKVATEFLYKYSISYFRRPLISDFLHEEKLEIKQNEDYNTEYHEKITQISKVFRRYGVKRVSVGTFGPIRSLNHYDDSGSYGVIGGHRPQTIIADFDFEASFKEVFETYRRTVSFFLNTDANCSAVGEFFNRERGGIFPFKTLGPHPSQQEVGKDRYNKTSTMLAYVIVGSGIGGGFSWGGYIVRDRMHPEMGHLGVKKHPMDVVESCCGYHGRDNPCIEGLASNRAHFLRLLKMKNKKLALEIRAYYIAQLASAITLILAPSAIVIDLVHGTLEERQAFVGTVKEAYHQLTHESGSHYPGFPEMTHPDYISMPYEGRTHTRIGPVGALYMATHTFMLMGSRQ